MDTLTYFLQQHLLPLAPFIKKETELSKDELLKTAAGKVNGTILEHLKQVEFQWIGKSEKGSVYLV